MTAPEEVTDPADPRVADFVGLRDRQLRPEARGDSGIFIAEGELVVKRLLAGRRRARAVLITPARLRSMAAEVAAAPVPVYLASQAVMDEVAGFAIHRGVLASAWRWPLPEVAEVAAGARLLVACEGVNDHENLGSLFRNSAAFGVEGLILDPRTADPLYRRCVRVSMGHVLDLAFARSSTWPEDLRRLRDGGFDVVALTPDPAAPPLDRPGSGRPTVLVVGAEGSGLSAAATGAAGRRARIPMARGVDSLNVATAAAVALSWTVAAPGPGRP